MKSTSIKKKNVGLALWATPWHPIKGLASHRRLDRVDLVDNGAGVRSLANPSLLLVAFSLLCVFSTTPASANSQAIETAVQHPQMALGQTNTYTITIRNVSNIPHLDPPSVSGLVFSRTPSSHTSARIINNQSSRETILSWRFQAERQGTYVIPGRDIDVLGQRMRLEPVTVEVTGMSPEMSRSFSLRWKTPPAPFYVGQAIPATLELRVRADIRASLGSHPDGSNDQFIKQPFAGEPRQTQQRIDGQIYSVVEWDTVITPIRSGRGSLPVALTLLYETGEHRRDFFGMRQIQEQIRLTTETADWEILDLPRRNRPESFSGAVGSFNVQSRLSAQEAEAGDPLTLTLEVSGEGNFERIQAPEIPETDGWRIYPPRARMTEDTVPYRGVKTFEYILTPMHESVEEAPPLAFSWFDPDRAVWEERTLGSDPVRIRPGTPSATSGPLTQTPAPASALPDVYSLQPMAQIPGRTADLSAPWQHPVFWAVNGGMGLLAAAALIGLMRQQRTAQNPYLQLRSEATRKARDLARQAVAAANRRDAAAFYQQATQSLRHFLAFLDPQPHNPDSLTWTELEAILQKFAFDESALAHTRTLFSRQDAVHFAGWKPGPDELIQDRETFETLLNQIASRKP